MNKSLLQLYLDNRKEIRTILGELAPKLPSYHSLEWRLDVQVTSLMFLVFHPFLHFFFLHYKNLVNNVKIIEAAVLNVFKTDMILLVSHRQPVVR